MDSSPRHVVIEHPARDGWELAKGLKPEESSASKHRFRLEVKPGASETLTIDEYEPSNEAIELDDLDHDQVALLVNAKAINDAVKATLDKVLVQKDEIASLEQQIKAREKEMQQIERDQARVRGNMKALKGSSEERSLLQRYASQLNTQEDRLIALRKEVETLQDNRDKLNEELEKIIAAIDIDQTS